MGGPSQFPPFLQTHEGSFRVIKLQLLCWITDVLYGNGNSSPSKLSTERCATVRIHFTPEASLNRGNERGSFNSTCRSETLGWNSRLKMHVPWNLVTMRSRVYASRRNTFIIPPRSDQLNRIPRINRGTLFLPPILNIRSTTFFFLN